MKQKQFTVEIPYIQKYLPQKRCRREREREQTGTVTFTVTELSSDEFPVALITHKYETAVEGATEETIMATEGDFRIFDEEYRRYNGSLYKPVRSSYGAKLSTLIRTPECLPRLVRRESHMEYVHPYSPDKPYTEDSVVASEDLPIREALVQCTADDFIICDNEVWKKAGMPVYVIVAFGLGHNHGGTGFFIEERRNPRASERNYFRADHLDEALAHYNKVAERRGDTESIGRYDDKKVRIDVLMPEILATA